MWQTISLKGKRSLIAGYTLAKSSREWIVFLPESGSDFREGSRKELAALAGAQAARRFNFLVINKNGIGPGKNDKAAYETSFRREKRIQDALQTLKAIVPASHKIHLIGYSEGAYLAPQVATRDQRVVSLTMIGGGTRGWLKEELSNASSREKPIYQRQIREIHAHPKSLKKWNGFSYATWYSYRGDHTLRALRELKIPILAILGARDKVIDLKSTIVDLMLVSEHKPTNLHVFGDCGHYFTKHWPHVARVLGHFLNR